MISINKFAPVLVRGARSLVKNNIVKRNVSVLCARSRNPPLVSTVRLHQCMVNKNYSAVATQTKGDKELAEFLKDEVAAETKAQTFQELPTLLHFNIEQNGADLLLKREFNGENITIKLNVNHTVETQMPEGEPSANQEKQEVAVMKSKPSFMIEINRGGKVLGFSCSYVQKFEEEPHAEGDSFSDVFNIDEFAVHEGEWKDTTYAVSGEIMDGYLYDLLMNLLEERGISNEFAEKLSDYATAYEHKQYIGILQNLKSFAEAK